MQSGTGAGRSRFPGDFAGVLAGARGNAPAAWNELYAWLAPGVAGYLRMAGARDVDDLTCEVLLAVFRRIGSFTGDEANFRSWVFNVAHSRLIDDRRRRARTPETVPLDGAFEPGAPAASSESEAMRALGTSAVETICEQLPPDQRTVILLRIVADLGIEQVAEIVGKSPGAVKQLQRRGFETARRIFAQQGVTL